MKVIFKKGSSLIEILVVISLVAILVSACVVAATIYIKLSLRTTTNVKAGYLLEEGIESLKIMRDTSWTTNISSLIASSTYYLLYQNNTWVATTTLQTIDDSYTRTFSVYDVYRDASDDVSSSGTLDDNTKKVTVRVSWIDPVSKASTTKSLSTYITNLFDN